MSALREAALAYCARGWSVFPLADKRRPHVPWKQYQSERPTRELVEAWWTEWPDAYIGVALGQVSGLLRVDAEGEGEQKLAALGGLPNTLTFKSPGGMGWLLAHCDGVTTEVLWSGAGEHNELRVQAAGAYTVLPPSPGYQWLNDAKPAGIPGWLLEHYTAKVLTALEKELRPTLRLPDSTEVLEALAFIPPDEYDQWVHVGMALRSAGDDYLTVWDKWSSASPKYKEGECAKKWQTFMPGGLTTRSILYWAEKYGYRLPNRHEPLTELGNARILARMGEGKILHSEKWGWLAWDGRRWRMDDAEKVVVEMQKAVLEYRLARAMESFRKLLQVGKDAEDFEKRKQSKLATIRMIRMHEDERSIRGARKLAESEPSMSVDYLTFNNDPWLLNCANGTLNLRSCELLAHDSSSRLTQLCPTQYIESADCPRWRQFLEEVFPGDAALIAWIQRLLGYSLVGTIREHVLPIFHGVGRNGKSTLLKTVLAVLGPDYAGTTPSEFLMLDSRGQHPTKFVELYGKRFMIDMETGDGARLNEEIVKRITGGDEIKARKMKQDFFSFKPTHKLVLCTNHEPKVRGMDVAIWSRIKLVPFQEVFEGARQDKLLDETLLREASGILNWMLEGCLQWQKHGLGDVEAVSTATAAYKGGQDTVMMFFQERIEKAVGQRVKRADILSAYKGWCLSQGLDPVPPNTFTNTLLRLGVQADPNGKWYVDIKL